MTRVLVVADEAWARNDVHSALTTPDYELVDHDDPKTVASVSQTAVLTPSLSISRSVRWAEWR